MDRWVVEIPNTKYKSKLQLLLQFHYTFYHSHAQSQIHRHTDTQIHIDREYSTYSIDYSWFLLSFTWVCVCVRMTFIQRWCLCIQQMYLENKLEKLVVYSKFVVCFFSCALSHHFSVFFGNELLLNRSYTSVIIILNHCDDDCIVAYCVFVI